MGDKSDSYLIDLWLSVATDAPTGILKGWNEEDIADASGWDNRAGKFVEALIECNWLEKDSDLA